MCIQWFYMKYSNTTAILHHSPNENSKGDTITMIKYNTKMKRLGRLNGYPDITIFYKGQVLLIELKSEKGILSPAQKELFKKFYENNWDVHIVRTLDNFIEIVENFVKIIDTYAKNRVDISEK